MEGMTSLFHSARSQNKTCNTGCQKLALHICNLKRLRKVAPKELEIRKNFGDSYQNVENLTLTPVTSSQVLGAAGGLWQSWDTRPWQSGGKSTLESGWHRTRQKSQPKCLHCKSCPWEHSHPLPAATRLQRWKRSTDHV